MLLLFSKTLANENNRVGPEISRHISEILFNLYTYGLKTNYGSTYHSRNFHSFLNWGNGSGYYFPTFRSRSKKGFFLQIFFMETYLNRFRKWKILIKQKSQIFFFFFDLLEKQQRCYDKLSLHFLYKVSWCNNSKVSNNTKC